MFGPPLPWGRSPLPDMHALLTTRRRSRYSSYPHTHTHAHFPPLPTPSLRPYPQRSHRPYRTTHKHPRFSSPSPPSDPSFSSAEWSDDEGEDEDSDLYTLDTDADTDLDRIRNRERTYHHHHDIPRYSTPSTNNPNPNTNTNTNTRSLRISLPREPSNTHLRPNTLLLLPTLTTLHIRILTTYPHRGNNHRRRDSSGEEANLTLDAAAPPELRFRDAVKQVVHYHVSDAVRSRDVRAYVKVGGRWVEPAMGAVVGDLSRDVELRVRGARELEVEVLVDGGDERIGGGRERGPRRRGRGVVFGFGVEAEGERVWEREESRVRVGV